MVLIASPRHSNKISWGCSSAQPSASSQNPGPGPQWPVFFRRFYATTIDQAPRRQRFIRRKKSGQFKESDDVGRSLSQDPKRKAKTVTKKGEGDLRQVVGLSGRFRWLFFADLFEILLPLLLRQFAPVLPGALRRCSRLGSG